MTFCVHGRMASLSLGEKCHACKNRLPASYLLPTTISGCPETEWRFQPKPNPYRILAKSVTGAAIAPCRDFLYFMPWTTVNDCFPPFFSESWARLNSLTMALGWGISRGTSSPSHPFHLFVSPKVLLGILSLAKASAVLWVGKNLSQIPKRRRRKTHLCQGWIYRLMVSTNPYVQPLVST